ncbi:integrase catalytic domain-containing protein [Trichonephila clavipes]|nr:integrase catalytic domain-containing protein [Trichonephila clavipes]
MNPADALSRGCSPRHLLESKWFGGLEWLLGDAVTWPTNESQCETKVLDCERRKIKLCNLNVTDKRETWYSIKFSNYHSTIRMTAWVLRSLSNCRKIDSEYNVGPVKNESVSLPADRVRDAGVFEVIGIDLAGPLFLKNGEKVWVVLYTCAVYRAVHLELVTALSTNNFLLSLRRFIARRGRPSVVYTDNGINFRGAVREFKNLD